MEWKESGFMVEGREGKKEQWGQPEVLVVGPATLWVNVEGQTLRLQAVGELLPSKMCPCWSTTRGSHHEDCKEKNNLPSDQRGLQKQAFPGEPRKKPACREIGFTT